MKYYIDSNGQIYAYADDGSDDEFIGEKTPIEGDALTAALAIAAEKAKSEIEAIKG